VTTSLAVFEAAIWVQSMHVIKSCLKTRTKIENMEIKKFLHKSPSKTSFRHRIHNFLKRADVRGSAGIIYRFTRISLVCGSGIVIEVRK